MAEPVSPCRPGAAARRMTDPVIAPAAEPGGPRPDHAGIEIAGADVTRGATPAIVMAGEMPMNFAKLYTWVVGGLFLVAVGYTLAVELITKGITLESGHKALHVLIGLWAVVIVVKKLEPQYRPVRVDQRHPLGRRRHFRLGHARLPRARRLQPPRHHPAHDRVGDGIGERSADEAGIARMAITLPARIPPSPTPRNSRHRSGTQ